MFANAKKAWTVLKEDPEARKQALIAAGIIVGTFVAGVVLTKLGNAKEDSRVDVIVVEETFPEVQNPIEF